MQIKNFLSIVATVSIILIATVLMIRTYNESHQATFSPLQAMAITNNKTVTLGYPGSFNIHNTQQETKKIIIHQNSDGKEYQIHRGDSIVLKLGHYDWNVSVSEPSALDQLKSTTSTSTLSTQGIYIARRPGTNIIMAQGRPHCNAQKICPMFIINFKVTITVLN